MQLSVSWLEYFGWLVCQKQVSRAGTSNYIPQILWDVITCPCLWYLLLTHRSTYLYHPMYIDSSLFQVSVEPWSSREDDEIYWSRTSVPVRHPASRAHTKCHIYLIHWSLGNVDFKLIFQFEMFNNSHEIAHRRILQNPFDDKSTLVKIMA